MPGKKTTKKTTKTKVKTWKDFQAECLKRENLSRPILLPVYVGINASGEIVRHQIELNELGSPCKKDSLIAHAIANAPIYDRERLTKIHEEYDGYFGSQNKSKSVSGFPPSPLDFQIKMPVIFMFYLMNKNWSFTGNRQFSVENDNKANPTLKQICSFDGMRGILIESNNQATERLKYNFHTTIAQYVTNSQTQESQLMTTDIIIDPGVNNDHRGGGGGSGSGGD